MFHHRSVGFGSSANAHSANILRSNHGQNENLMIHRGNQMKPSGMKSNAGNKNPLGGKSFAANNLSKTPSGKQASTTRRRAFGDISNKKASNSGFGRELSAKQPQLQQRQKPHPSDVLKPRSSNLLPRVTRNPPSTQKARFVPLPEEPKPFQSQQQQKPLQQQSTKSKNAVRPREPYTAPITRAKSRALAKAQSVPDIELPAGRTWKQQLEYDLKDEDDLASISSLESIVNLKDCLGPRTLRKQARELEWKRQKEEADEDDRQLAEQMKAMMDREQKEAEESLEILYDVIDNLDIFSDDGLGNLEKIGNNTKRDDFSLSDSSEFDLGSSGDELSISF
mmetsp:Transcript_11491/g.26985  ORF Transcript_11491/g.26985 Transcript_11491/m.26985 type:complete len:337 (+) Transcript_11491:172-1182(+)|eukprot:CAMPEP_0172398974 /NCGR_PEP_ID=MMETSP1061-20121228/38658_1 /TAXON_ID=37318 /ORGANISM="Pseudo-nitzschia pungens, Strain cf. pungens" /LENGTH=336 /DNA_ID=CAMNT_0013131693 /DNA_START=122 /DNA_END=1132 /DNA_ORIENTATION=-